MKKKKYSRVVQLVERLTVNQDAERNRRFESCLASSTLVHLEVGKNEEVSRHLA